MSPAAPRRSALSSRDSRDSHSQPISICERLCSPHTTLLFATSKVTTFLGPETKRPSHLPETKFLTGAAAVGSGGRNDIGTDRHFVGQVAGFVVSGETMDAPMVQCLFEMEQYDSPFPLSAFRFPCSIFQPANECQIYRMRAIYLIGICAFACAARRCRAR